MADSDLPYTEERDKRWYRKDIESKERYRYLLSTANRIRKNQTWRKEADVGRLRLYGSTANIGSGIAGTTRPTVGSKRRVGYNVVKCVSDARTAKITKEKPKVMFVTSGGDWRLKQKAKAMTKFIAGQFYELELYEHAPTMVRDGDGLFGKGLWKFYIDGEGEDARIRFDRVLPLEILVDEQEGLRGRPPNLIHECWVDRVVLEALYEDEPEKLKAIRECKSGHDPHLGTHLTVGYDSTADQILCVEGWHRPSKKPKKNDDGEWVTDGRRCLAIEGCTLEDETWRHEWFPFVEYSSDPSPLGWWGIPITDVLEGLQESINRKLLRIDKSINMLGAGHVLKHSASKVNFGQWDNEVGSLIEYTGVKPELLIPTEVVSGQVFQQLDRDYSKAFGLTGTPEMEAQGAVPSNLESGKAQEVHLDVTDQRIQVAINRYHHMFLQAARMILELAREIVEKHNPKYQCLCAGNGGLETVILKENDLADDECILQMWPTNGLADEPEARMAQIERAANAGWLAPDEAKRLLDWPDTEDALSLENASYNAVEMCISKMLDEGRWIEPIPFLNLQQAIMQVQLALVRAWGEGRPDSRLQLLRDWLNAAKKLPLGPGPQAPQMQAGVPGTPVAAAPAAGVTPAMQGQAPPAGAPPQAA